ncbi:MAG: DUF2971 domain-containing protein [Pseudoalteromonas sp.]|uniref:DUF2971 domain-containing protein n=1 Tax=Pseudoalteromonas sp. TaxID=53249 RepID=UPI0025FD5C54|nr:DUF2971 domain-containing protein [Pseudoalteromonas sp.]MCH2088746.1 DUF2971 domain-containing protein [Pseudoalteromonas sp.]
MEYPEVKHLYKFRGLRERVDADGQVIYNEYTLAMLDKNTAWMARPTTFNDPFDCNYRPIESRIKPKDKLFLPESPPSEFEAEIMSSISQESSPRDIERAIFRISEYRNDHIEYELKNFCVLSLAEDCNHILMWAHYAVNHTGICLIYDRVEGKEFTSDLCRPIRYRTYDYEISHEDFQRFFRVDGRGEDWVKTNNLLTNALFTKAECWFYEKEWRFVSFFPLPAKGFNLTIDTPITGIIFGCKTLEEDKEFIMSRYGDKFNYYQAWKCKHDYRVEVVPEEDWRGRDEYYKKERGFPPIEI